MSSTSSPLSSSTALGTSSVSASAASATLQLPSSLKVIGIILAVLSGILIGSSFVFKKKGLLRSQAGHAAGEGVAYLKSPLWWTGMTMMITGELCNFVAYAFVEALVVTPMGALSVVICAMLSSIFLNEKLSFFGWLGCGLCIIGSTIIALNGPQETTPGEIEAFMQLFIAPGFLVYISLLIVIALSIIFYFGPKYGKQNMLWYITVCSTIGGISVSVTTGLGAAIVMTAMGVNQFTHWFIYFLIAFVAVTLITEVYFLNVALALFNTAMVTPTYYVLFSFCSMVTTIVLFRGLSAPVSQILTLVFAFLTICVGITILQMSKIDPSQLSKLDRRSTMLLQAARATTEDAEEKGVSGMEDPGMDALRAFGTVGSIIRARSSRRMSQSSRLPNSSLRSHPDDLSSTHWQQQDADHAYDGLTRHQLYDAPVPRLSDPERSSVSSRSTTPYSPRRTTIKFGSQDLVHSYRPPGSGNDVIHEHRSAVHSTPPIQASNLPHLYPPTPNTGTPTTPGTQSINIPPRANDEPPAPTLSTNFENPSTRDPFETPTTPTMTTFPSTSDLLTNNSPPRDSGGRNNVRPPPRPHRSGSSPRYPKGIDDADENISLWERSPIHEVSEGESDEMQPAQGIRLVKPSSSTWL